MLRILISFALWIQALLNPPISGWVLVDGALKTAPITRHELLPFSEESNLNADLDPAMECVVLQEDTLKVLDDPCLETSAVIYQTSEHWKVVSYQISDLNQNGVPDLTLLVWRPFKPWLIDPYVPNPGRINAHQTEDGQSSHVIVLEVFEGRLKEYWAGSALVDPVLWMAATDLNQDGLFELAALEGKYTHPQGPAERLSVWQWNGFGFTLIDAAPVTAEPQAVLAANAEYPQLLILQTTELQE